MARIDREPAPRRGIVRLLLGGLGRTLVALFCLLGIGVAIIAATSHFYGAPLSPQVVEDYLVLATPTKATLAWVWGESKFLMQYGAFLIGAVAFLISVARIHTVAALIRDFIEARGPIYQLSTTITQAERNSKELLEAVKRVSDLRDTIEKSAERVEEALIKIGDLERLAVVDERTVPADEEADTATAATEQVDANKERLRELWNANGRRLDTVMQRIPDKRLRKRFSQMSKRNYAAIIDSLFEAQLITPAAHKASSQLHSTFLSYRSRKKPVSEKLVGDMLVLDELLEQELSSRQNLMNGEAPLPTTRQQTVETREGVGA